MSYNVKYRVSHSHIAQGIEELGAFSSNSQKRQFVQNSEESPTGTSPTAAAFNLQQSPRSAKHGEMMVHACRVKHAARNIGCV